jgi:hypothetical protein
MPSWGEIQELRYTFERHHITSYLYLPCVPVLVRSFLHCQLSSRRVLRPRLQTNSPKTKSEITSAVCHRADGKTQRKGLHTCYALTHRRPECMVVSTSWICSSSIPSRARILTCVSATAIVVVPGTVRIVHAITPMLKVSAVSAITTISGIIRIGHVRRPSVARAVHSWYAATAVHGSGWWCGKRSASHGCGCECLNSGRRVCRGLRCERRDRCKRCRRHGVWLGCHNRRSSCADWNIRRVLHACGWPGYDCLWG